MEPKQKRVLIVQGGTFGPEHYAVYIRTIKSVLESVCLSKKTGEADLGPAAIVEIVSSGKEAEIRATKREVDIVIFVSVSMLGFARQLRAKFNELVVYILAGIDVSGEPYLVPKTILHPEAIKQILD